ncbi:hypothetical protein [Neobacillus jeddahensis]|uniref:hypothetical protein n=1 Tax=Neobacillus jeddahensis TaxID=1461580 RepID=UPI000A48F205|nr:hypothetical protein [Neobacillus jeddahensis]
MVDKRTKVVDKRTKVVDKFKNVGDKSEKRLINRKISSINFTWGCSPLSIRDHCTCSENKFLKMVI